MAPNKWNLLWMRDSHSNDTFLSSASHVSRSSCVAEKQCSSVATEDKVIPPRIPAWRDRVMRLTADQVVKGSSPATGHIRCALLAN